MMADPVLISGRVLFGLQFLGAIIAGVFLWCGGWLLSVGALDLGDTLGGFPERLSDRLGRLGGSTIGGGLVLIGFLGLLTDFGWVGFGDIYTFWSFRWW